MRKISPPPGFFFKQTVFVTLVTVEIQLHFLQGQTNHRTQRINSIGVTSTYLYVIECTIELLAWWLKRVDKNQWKARVYVSAFRDDSQGGSVGHFSVGSNNFLVEPDFWDVCTLSI